MPNPNPSPATRFQPVEAAYVSRSFRLRPDQVERLALEENQSAVARAALDAYFSIHAPPDDDTDYDAALAAMAARTPSLKWNPANGSPFQMTQL